MAAQPPDAPDGPARQPELAPPSPSEIDPLNPPSPTGRFTDDTPDGRTRLTPARRSLLSAYSAVAPPPRAGRPPLAEVLAQLDPQLARQIDDPMDELVRAATLWKDPSGPRIHPLQLAFASMAVLGRAPDWAPRDEETFEPIVQVLAPRDQRASPDVDVDLRRALVRAGAPDVDPRKRWAVLRQEMGGNLAPELRPIRVAWCIPELRLVDNEYVSRVETRLVVEDGTPLDELAQAVLPDNWQRCNDFFCSLRRRADRDAGCSPPATGGDLRVDGPGWRGVYEERVGTCPDGWFPDTYLLFTWSKTPQQIILRYELAPRRSGDRTVLRIDEGYIQVDRVGPCYEVSTVKYLLFDDRYLNGGGQTLAQSACQLGWLDYSVNQFTACARGLGATGRAVGPAAPPADGDEQLDPGVRHVLDECQGPIVESVTETDEQVRRSVGRIRAGDYGADDWVTDMSELTARAIRDGARSILGYRDLLLNFEKLARKLAGPSTPIGQPSAPRQPVPTEHRDAES